MRNTLIVANWKMHKTKTEGEDFVNEFKNLLQTIELNNNKKVIIIPPFLHVQYISDLVENTAINVGVQNIHSQTQGAFTGSVSANMAKSFGAEYVIIGHSERRKYQKETNEILKNKVEKALEFDLKPIYCCGETLKEREENNHFQLIENQIKEGLFDLNEKNFSKINIAYEPVWAIGTGKTASPEQAQEIHQFIRELINCRYGQGISQNTSILYGGSVKASNTKELLSKQDIDGALIGGASLIAKEFFKIVSLG